MAESSDETPKNRLSTSEPAKAARVGLLDQLSKATGLAAALAFLLSVIYDWAYLDALGLSFAMVPTSISDHVRTSLIWLPTTAMLSGASVTAGFFTGRASRTLAGRLRPRERHLLLLSLVGGGFLMVGGFIASGGIPALLYLTLSLLAMPLSLYLHARFRKQDEPPVRGVELFILIPTVTLLVAAWGAIRAEGDRHDSRPIATFKAPSTETGKLAVRPIRHFERVVLAIDERANVRMLRAEDLLSVEDLPRPYYYSGALCVLFGFKCYPMQSTRGASPR